MSEGLSRKLARASNRAILECQTYREAGELVAAVEALPAIGVPVAGLGEAGKSVNDERPGDPAELG